MAKKEDDYGKLMHVVCHRITKEQNSKDTTHVYADRLSTNDSPDTIAFFKSFMKERTSSRRDTSYSAFRCNVEGDAAVMQKNLHCYLDSDASDSSFMSTSVKIAAHFEYCLMKTPQAIGGILVMFDYDKNGHHYFVVSLMNEEISSSLNTDLTLLSGKALNIKQVAFSAIIDCTNWLDDELLKNRPNYIVLASGVRDMPDYYKTSFIGCDRVVAGEANTIKFMESIDSFCIEKGFDKTRVEQIHERIAKYCDSHKKEAVMCDMLNCIFPETADQEEYYQHCSLHDFEISASFRPSVKALNHWKRLEYNKNGINLKINMERIEDKTARYDRESKLVVIKDETGELETLFGQFSKDY